MSSQKIVVFLGSKSDRAFAQRIEEFVARTRFPVACEYRVNSAHRNLAKLLSDLKAYEESRENIVYVTVAGLSDSLSGVVAGYTAYPVIACPPDVEKHGLPKVFSSLMTPKGVPVALVPDPENAALAAIKIFALSDISLRNNLQRYLATMRETVNAADTDIVRAKS